MKEVLAVSGFSSPNMLIAGCNRVNGRIKCYESMEQHLRGVRFLIDSYLSPYIGYVDDLALKLFNIKPSEHMLYVAAAMHDIGKALPGYQQSLRLRCTAGYHEVASAALTLLLLDYGEYEVIPVALAVLLHHHAMRPPYRLCVESPADVKRYVLCRVREDVAKYVMKYLEIASGVFNIRLRVGDVRLNESSIGRAVDGVFRIVKTLSQHRDEYARIYKLSTVMLFPLVVADIMAARVQRACVKLSVDTVSEVRDPIGGEVTKYSELIKAFRKGFRGVVSVPPSRDPGL